MGTHNLAFGRLIIRSCLVALALMALFAVHAIPAAAIARGYKTSDTGLQVGMVVALGTESNDDSEVERATQNNNQRVVGVVTSFDASFVTVASSTASVLVESEGEVQVYVSDLGGPVTQGSLLVLSPLKGVLMKAAERERAPVIGIAAENSSGTGSVYEFDDNGTKRTTTITKVKVNLNRQGAANNGSYQEPSSLARLGQAIVGREVGETRVLVALILFIIVLIAEGGIMYGAISSAITALGRNPLARQVIRREMLRVIIVAIVVLLVGLGAVYTVLWV